MDEQNEQEPAVGDIKFENENLVVWNGDRWVQSRLFENQALSAFYDPSEYSSYEDPVSFSVPETQISLMWEKENEPVCWNVDQTCGFLLNDDFTAEMWAALTDDFIDRSFSIQQETTTSALRINTSQMEMLVNVHTDGTLEYGPSYNPDEAAKVFWEAMTGTNPTFLQSQISDLEHLYNVSQQLQDLYVTRYYEALEEITSVRDMLGVPKETSLHDFVKQTYNVGKEQVVDASSALSSALKTFK